MNQGNCLFSHAV